jgi:cytochrome d ubiquinol oxidase subunit II
MLLAKAPENDKDTMVASIGPFWDANETWLVLGIGVLLVAFPMAHGVILTSLYLPVAVMLAGLILRGVAFDFRVKARAAHKPLWNTLFAAGSALAAFAQGYMLALYIVGFERNVVTVLFGLLIGACLATGYALLGATWLIMKTEGELQLRAVRWATLALGGTTLGVGAVSIATPLVSERIFSKWFALPEFVLLLPIPIATLVVLFVTYRSLGRLPVRLAQQNEYGAWVPFGCTVALFVLAFYGLAYSLFPYLVVDRLDIWQAASAPESLLIIFVGAAVVLPVIISYTVFAYRVFWGKARALDYG